MDFETGQILAAKNENEKLAPASMTKMMTSYIIEQKLLKGQPKAKPFGKLIDGKFLTGRKSLHWTKQSRNWQLFWRIKKYYK